MRLSMIVAMAANRAIGRDNRMPWHLPPDLTHFKRVTLGHPVIMGRRTYESILATLGRPLPGRLNVVISRRLDYRADPGRLAAPDTPPRVVDSPAAARAAAAASGADEAFVVGGAEIYRAMLPAAARLVVTEIARDFDGDAFFPPIDPRLWREVARAPQPRGGEPAVDYAFVEYHRKEPA
ncbi:MAG: dihydrofolate reductase [Burkholderiales bacterium]|nr:dihydrofolate reductase [Burkholderiales bacterium]